MQLTRRGAEHNIQFKGLRLRQDRATRKKIIPAYGGTVTNMLKYTHTVVAKREADRTCRTINATGEDILNTVFHKPDTCFFSQTH